MYTLEQIHQFMRDPEAQAAASWQELTDLREEAGKLLADKPVTLRNYRRQLDELRKKAKAQKAAEKKLALHVSIDPDAKYVCRCCGVALAPTAKAVMEHYEKKHYSEYVSNRAAMADHPRIFVKQA